MSVIKDPKHGLNKSKSNMGTWGITGPEAYRPDSSAAKPGGNRQGGAYANKHANTTSVNNNSIADFQKRY